MFYRLACGDRKIFGMKKTWVKYFSVSVEWALSSYDKRPAALVRKYGDFYAQTNWASSLWWDLLARVEHSHWSRSIQLLCSDRLRSLIRQRQGFHWGSRWGCFCACPPITVSLCEFLTSAVLHSALIWAQLKTFLLQLSFRSVSGTVETKRDPQVRRILQLPPSSSGCTKDGPRWENIPFTGNFEKIFQELEAAITAYLRRATETFDLSKNVEVCKLI